MDEKGNWGVINIDNRIILDFEFKDIKPYFHQYSYKNIEYYIFIASTTYDSFNSQLKWGFYKKFKDHTYIIEAKNTKSDFFYFIPANKSSGLENALAVSIFKRQNIYYDSRNIFNMLLYEVKEGKFEQLLEYEEDCDTDIYRNSKFRILKIEGKYGVIIWDEDVRVVLPFIYSKIEAVKIGSIFIGLITFDMENNMYTFLWSNTIRGEFIRKSNPNFKSTNKEDLLIELKGYINKEIN